MGMFDSFYVECEGTEHEVQTKRFGKMLDAWRVGDVINRPGIGVHVLFDERYWDDHNHTLEYAYEHDNEDNCVVFVVIVNGVYVYSTIEFDYYIDQHLNEDKVSNAIKYFTGIWEDSSRHTSEYVSIIRKKQQEIATYRRQLQTIEGYIREYTAVGKEHGLKHNITRMHYPKLDSVKTTDDLVSVVNDIASSALVRTNTGDDTSLQFEDADVFAHNRV